jgi:RNA ligase (TIGR02306 family)
MRKLASIQRVIALRPIENADAIEVADILGWHVVVKKGEFKVGDLCVYCEIDSILPEREEFEFLRPRKFRIRTIKLRGQISQGVCFPLSVLNSVGKLEKEGDNKVVLYIEGDNIQNNELN